MGYAMMWMEWLAAAILFAAVATACLARLRRPRLRVGLSVVAALVPVIKGAVIAFGFAFVAMITLREWYTYHWFLYWFFWTVCSAAGIVWVLVAGLRRRGEPAPRAASWPRGKLALGLVAVLLLSWITFWNLDLSIKGRLASLRAEAGALALSVAPARPAESENAAPVYRQAFDALGKGDDLPPEFNEKWADWINGHGSTADFDPADPKLAAFLARSEGAMSLLRRAAAMPACYFDHDYGRPSIWMLLPEMTDSHRSARLLALDACAKASRGQTDRAMEDIRAVFGIARHSTASPILISLLIAAGSDEAGVTALETVLNSSQPSAGQLAGLDLSPPGMLQRNLPRALRMEEAFGVSVAVDIGLADDPLALRYILAVTAPAELLVAGWRVFLSQEEVAAYRGGVREYERLADLPYYAAAAEWKTASQPESICRRGILAARLIPSLGSCAKRLAQGDARHGAAYLAVAAARYRAEKGRMPETLDALVPQYLPAVPRDPFDGKPLRMVARDGRLVFYSIGPDMKDDGGAALGEEDGTGDIVFSLPLN